MTEGRADMVEEGGVVEGKLYRVPPEAITYLYGREGVDNNGYRPAIISVEHEGKMVDHVLTFFVLNKEKRSRTLRITIRLKLLEEQQVYSAK